MERGPREEAQEEAQAEAQEDGRGLRRGSRRNLTCWPTPNCPPSCISSSDKALLCLKRWASMACCACSCCACCAEGGWKVGRIWVESERKVDGRWAGYGWKVSGRLMKGGREVRTTKQGILAQAEGVGLMAASTSAAPNVQKVGGSQHPKPIPEPAAPALTPRSSALALVLHPTPALSHAPQPLTCALPCLCCASRA